MTNTMRPIAHARCECVPIEPAIFNASLALPLLSNGVVS
jgi:hypothetical protein